jgi:hypothetical protein
VKLAPEEKRKEFAHWYEGAHKIAHELAEKYGVDDASAAGVIAALSPQQDWSQNVYFADQVLDVYHEQGKHPWDADMEKTAKAIWTTKEQKALLGLIRDKKLDDLDNVAAKAMWIRTYNEAHEDRTFHAVLPSGEMMASSRLLAARHGRLLGVRSALLPTRLPRWRARAIFRSLARLWANDIRSQLLQQHLRSGRRG